MSAGYVGISWSKSDISKVIQFFRDDIIYDDKDEIPTHCFITFGNLVDEIIVGEATNPKIRLAPLSKFYYNKDKKVRIYRLPDVTEELKEAALKDLFKLTGIDYGYVALIGFMAVWAAFKIGIKADNPISNDDIIVCSKYVFRYLKNINWKDSELMGMSSKNVAPDHILRSLEKYAELVAYSNFGEIALTWV